MRLRNAIRALLRGASKLCTTIQKELNAVHSTTDASGRAGAQREEAIGFLDPDRDQNQNPGSTTNIDNDKQEPHN